MLAPLLVLPAELVGVHRNTAAYYFHRLRDLIAEHVDNNTWFDGEIELVESYFGDHCKGLGGRGAVGKVPVFGLLQRGGKVYTKVIPDAKSRTLLPIIESKTYPDSIVYTDNFASYDVLDVGHFKHYRINHGTQGVDKITSMALKIFGTRRSVICVSLIIFKRLILNCTLRNVSDDLTHQAPNSN